MLHTAVIWISTDDQFDTGVIDLKHYHENTAYVLLYVLALGGHATYSSV